MDRAGGRRESLWYHGGSRGAHLHSGSAIECEGFDLPVLQENLQHIGNEEESFFLQHVLARRASNRGGKEDGGHRETEGGWGERMSFSDRAVMASSASLGLCAKRHIPLENPASLLSHGEVQSWSNSELPDRFTSPAPSSCSGNRASHSVRHVPDLCPCLAACPTPQLVSQRGGDGQGGSELIHLS